ncbi:MAG: DUF86 domain-containing protein [Flavobacteriales bacterium]|nr:DUF86 domain-containing protein [Flavobacteriales bacterium]
MSPSLLDFLKHIEAECDYLMRLRKDRDRAALLDDETNSRAIVRSLEVIGEAVKKLPVELRQKYPNINWSEMAGMRDVLIHHYFGIDYDIVWDVLENEIPALHTALHRIIEAEDRA